MNKYGTNTHVGLYLEKYGLGINIVFKDLMFFIWTSGTDGMVVKLTLLKDTRNALVAFLIRSILFSLTLKSWSV